MTFVECISADGKVLNPLVIFRGKTLQQQHFPDENLADFEQWTFDASENGYTSNKIGLKWLRDVFLPQTKSIRKEERSLLILDGYNSYITDEFI